MVTRSTKKIQEDRCTCLNFCIIAPISKLSKDVREHINESGESLTDKKFPCMNSNTSLGKID